MEDVCCTWIHPILNIALDFSKFRMASWISIICQNFYYLLFHLSIAFHLLILLASVIIASCATPSVLKGFRSNCRQGGLCYGYQDSHPHYTTYAYLCSPITPSHLVLFRIEYRIAFRQHFLALQLLFLFTYFIPIKSR